MGIRYEVTSTYKSSVSTGAVTTIAAATATAGHLLALRNPTAGARTIRLRSLEVEFLLTTAFGAAQRVGFDVVVARSYTAAHTAQTALDFTGNTGKLVAGTGGYDASTLTGRIAGTGALTAGTHTLDTNPIASGSAWFSAIGQTLSPRFYDFTATPAGGLYLRPDEGIVSRNTILMGATGVGTWTYTFEYDEGVLYV